MPLPDPTAGRAFIWLISCILFLSIAAGGAFLLMYMTLPPSDSISWLPVVGIALVCLPWFFWFLTFLYRLISRNCGFRFTFSSDNGGGGEHVANTTTRDVTFDDPEDTESNARQVQFQSVEVSGEQVSQQDKDRKQFRSSSSNSSNNDVSVRSHESEMPLASSMAT